MKLVIQITDEASVEINGKTVSAIKKGEVVLVSFTLEDNKAIVDKMIAKMLKLRIFPDKKGLTNLSIGEICGEILSISQFTLYASLKEGNRPAFTECLEKDKAKELYDYYVQKLSSSYPYTAYGIFHADMKVHLINDGPFTVILDSQELGYGR